MRERVQRNLEINTINTSWVLLGDVGRPAVVEDNVDVLVEAGNPFSAEWNQSNDRKPG